MMTKVILRSTVAKVGAAGDIKRVKMGFARNYLIPRGLAVPATEAAIAVWKRGDAKRQAKLSETLKAAKAAVDKIRGISLSFTRLAGEEGKIFGSVGKSDIVKSLKASGFEVDRTHIVLEAPLRAVGDFEVEIHLHPEAVAKVKVSVLARQ